MQWGVRVEGRGAGSGINGRRRRVRVAERLSSSRGVWWCARALMVGGVAARQSGGGRGSGTASTGKRGSSSAGHAPPLRPWVNGVRALSSVCLSSRPRHSPVARGGQACGSRRWRSDGAGPAGGSELLFPTLECRGRKKREKEKRKREPVNVGLTVFNSKILYLNVKNFEYESCSKLQMLQLFF